MTLRPTDANPLVSLRQRLALTACLLIPLILALPGTLQAAEESSVDCSAQTDLPAAQCETLVSLYQQANGSSWNDTTNWLNDSPCSWYGITCGDNTVERIYLTDNNVTGSIPSLSTLTDLQWLNFDFNAITGSLPNLSGLQKLEGVDLVANRFSGELPEFTNLPVLFYLNMGINNFTGSLPASLFTLPALRSLGIDGNGLTGSLPLELANSALESLSYDTNKLCSPAQSVRDWLLAHNGENTNLTDCWSVSLHAGQTQLATGDTLSVYARLEAPLLDTALDMDLYVSLLFPDGTTEAFVVRDNGVTSAELGSTDSASWVPAMTDVTLNPGDDTGLQLLMSYVMDGSESTGTYTWRFRATSPGSKEIISYAETDIYFNPNRSVMGILAATTGEVGQEISFSVQSNESIPGTTYHWEFDDGSSATGSSISRSFSAPDRYQVTLTAKVGDVTLPDSARAYVDVGRAYADTIYPLSGSQFSAMSVENRDFSWNDCEANWSVFEGKYHRLYMENSWEPAMNREAIVNALLFADFLFASYGEIFTWDFLPTTPGLDIYFCDDIQGGGTGTAGTFLPLSSFNGDGGTLVSAQDYPDFVHEFIHLWDFRDGGWLSSKDSAHALTAAMEPIMAIELDSGQGISSWGGVLNDLSAFSGDFLFNHYRRVGLNRYLSRSDLDWYSYFTEPFLSLGYDQMPIPGNKEHMLMPAGILMSLYQMHGLDGLQNIFREVERQLIAHPELREGLGYANANELERAEFFMRAVADSLQLDVSDYFSYWKWPVSTLDAYMARYPISPMVHDSDGDGYAPIHGDSDDSDASVFPYATEVIDGKDNNLDGLVDEYTYYEGGIDVANKEVQLPAFISGEISSLSDTDNYTFTLEEGAVVSVIMYSVDSDTSVAYASDNSRLNSTFAGSIYLNNRHYSELVHEAMSAPEALSAEYMPAGSHTITVSPTTLDNRNGNPGSYELQFFINTHDNKRTTENLIQILYP